MREISFCKIEEIKEVLGVTYKDIAEIMGIHPSQIQHYRRSNSLPITRYYALRDALLLDIHNQLREQQDNIMQLFNEE